MLSICNILLKGNQFNTKIDYFIGVDRDWRERKERQLWVEIEAPPTRTKVVIVCKN
jgi:hypothetical protein